MTKKGTTMHFYVIFLFIAASCAPEALNKTKSNNKAQTPSSVSPRPLPYKEVVPTQLGDNGSSAFDNLPPPPFEQQPKSFGAPSQSQGTFENNPIQNIPAQNIPIQNIPPSPPQNTAHSDNFLIGNWKATSDYKEDLAEQGELVQAAITLNQTAIAKLFLSLFFNKHKHVTIEFPVYFTYEKHPSNPNIYYLKDMKIRQAAIASLTTEGSLNCFLLLDKALKAKDQKTETVRIWGTDMKPKDSAIGYYGIEDLMRAQLALMGLSIRVFLNTIQNNTLQITNTGNQIELVFTKPNPKVIFSSPITFQK
jgi:hypothetical protein